MWNGEILAKIENLQRHVADLLGTVIARLRQTADDHVRIADRFDLVDGMHVNYGIECRIKLIKQLDDLHWLRIHRDRREADDVAKVNRDIFKLFRLHFDTVPQISSDRSGFPGG